MKKLLGALCLVVACAVAALPASVAPAKGGGVMCVLHAKLAAKNEVPPTTSVAKGHTHIKVRNDGTIEFKTQINNKKPRTFGRATSTRRPSASTAPSWCRCSPGPPVRATSSSAPW